MVALTADDAAKVLARLDAIRAGAEAHMRGPAWARRWYVIGSGQPEMNVGALNNTYNASMRALIDTEVDAVAGTYDAARWIDLAVTTETSMRAIDNYTDGTSVAAEIGFVAIQTIKDIPEVAPQIIGNSLRTVLGSFVTGLGSRITTVVIVVVMLLIGALYLIYMPHRARQAPQQ